MIRQVDGIPLGDRDEITALYGQIETIANSGDEKLQARTEFRHAWDTSKNEDLKALRSLFKEWGLTGISVRRAKGAWCYWPVVTVPEVRWDDPDMTIEDHYNHRDAVSLLQEAVLRLYPCFSTIFPDNIYQDGCTIRCTFG